MVTVISLQLLADRHHPVLYDVCSVMKLLKNNLSEHESYWSSKLLTSLQEMAAQKTNSVLQVLADVERLEFERHYPESALVFADKRWRAFYHCHESVSKHPNEHGHFHIFTDIGDQNWAHVAGLSIDVEGQPLQWFMVNRWVTDGIWLKRDDFFGQLAFVTTSDMTDGLTANWLASLLQFYRNDLLDLLEKRNAAIEQHLKKRDREEIFDDRDIYLLASESINLQESLEICLVNSKKENTPHAIEADRVGQGS